MNYFWTYMLRCNDGTLYTGSAKNLKNRFEQHKKGVASKYTRSRLPIKLVWAHPSRSWSYALRLEAKLKKRKKKEKEEIARYCCDCCEGLKNNGSIEKYMECWGTKGLKLDD